MTKAPPDPSKEFTKGLERIARTRGMHRAWEDFLELSYCALAKRAATSPQIAEELEARYMRAIKPYAESEDRWEFPKLMAIALTEGQKPQDFLGSLAGKTEVLNSSLGQFFTPWEVCMMMARITLDAAKDQLRRQGYITVQEPASGMGAMILACAHVLHEEGHDPSEVMLVHATDLGVMAFQGCYLQLVARGLPAMVCRGNTLTGEIFEMAYTPAALAFYQRRGHLFEKPTRKVRHRTRTRVCA